MKRIYIIILIFTFLAECLSAQVYVRGYFRKDGTYVQPHYRTWPDGNPYNNYSFPGNYNPYTGKISRGNPDTYLQNYYSKIKSHSYLPHPFPMENYRYFNKYLVENYHYLFDTDMFDENNFDYTIFEDVGLHFDADMFDENDFEYTISEDIGLNVRASDLENTSIKIDPYIYSIYQNILKSSQPIVALPVKDNYFVKTNVKCSVPKINTYYIILCSESSEAAAAKSVANFKNNPLFQHLNFYIFPTNVNGKQWYRVAIGEFHTYSMAQHTKLLLPNLPSGAWVQKY